jgi:hypothetical protein
MPRREFPYSQEFIKQKFDYDPIKGELIYKEHSWKKLKGHKAGFASNGYWKVYLKYEDKAQYLAHLVIWMWVFGKLPLGEIDHINGNRSDNRIENLRDISHRENICNQKKHRDGKLPGCSFQGDHKKFRVRYRIKGKLMHGGYFNTEEEANEMYAKLRKEKNLN